MRMLAKKFNKIFRISQTDAVSNTLYYTQVPGNVLITLSCSSSDSIKYQMKPYHYSNLFSHYLWNIYIEVSH